MSAYQMQPGNCMASGCSKIEQHAIHSIGDTHAACREPSLFLLTYSIEIVARRVCITPGGRNARSSLALAVSTQTIC